MTMDRINGKDLIDGVKETCKDHASLKCKYEVIDHDTNITSQMMVMFETVKTEKQVTKLFPGWASYKVITAHEGTQLGAKGIHDGSEQDKQLQSDKVLAMELHHQFNVIRSHLLILTNNVTLSLVWS